MSLDDLLKSYCQISIIANLTVCTKYLNLTICLGFRIIQFTIQEMVFRLCTKQSAGRKSQESRQLNNTISYQF